MIRRFWNRSPLMTLALAASVAACLIFAGRAALFTANLYWRAERPVAGWMTPRYIALAYGLDGEELAPLLETTDRDDLRRPLYAIARLEGMPTTDLIARIQALIDAKDGGP